MLVLPNHASVARPPWVFPWALVQADFAGDRFWRAPFDQRQFAPRTQSFMHDSGASNVASPFNNTTAPMRNGKLKIFDQGTLRITDMGLWSEALDTNYACHSRDLSITHTLSVTGASGTFTNGETITASGGGSGVYVQNQSILTTTPRTYALRGGSGTFTGTITGGTSGATGTISTSAAAWAASNMTAARTQTGADWRDTSNAATLLTATANNATILQSATVASNTFTVGARIRRVTGSGTVSMTVDGGSTWVDVTSQIGGNYSLVQIPTQTLANPQFGFRLATSGDQIAVDFFQCVDRNFLPTPVICFGLATQRTNNKPAINSEGSSSSYNQGVEMIRSFYSDSAQTIFLEYAGYGVNGNGTAVNLLGGTGATRCSAGVCGEAFGYGDYTRGGTQAVTSNGAKPAGIDNLNRAMGTVDGNARSCLNGGPVASGTANNNSNKFFYSHMVFGGNGDGSATINGRITRFAMGNTKVPDAMLIEATRF